MKKSLFILCILAALIITGGVVTAVVINNNMQRDNQNAERAAIKRERQENQKKLDDCITKANADYYSSIRFYKSGTTELDLNTDYSKLPISQDDLSRAEGQKKDDMNNCYKRYNQ
jgi:uncharacterized protein YxeA